MCTLDKVFQKVKNMLRNIPKRTFKSKKSA